MMKSHVHWSMALSVLCGAFLVSTSQARAAIRRSEQKALVLKGGLLIDGTGKAPLQNPVIVIAGNKIQSVGTGRLVSIPLDATVIDTTGKTIIPGLVDSHIHLRNFLAPLYLYWGVTTVGDMGNNLGWILAMREAVEKGTLQGPFIMSVGPLINSPPKSEDEVFSFMDRTGFREDQFLYGNGYAVYVTDEASLEATISRLQKAGVDAVKLYCRMEPALMKIAAKIAHRHGLKIFSHFTMGSSHEGIFLGIDEVLTTGIDTMLHSFGLVKATAPQQIRDRIAGGEDFEARHLLDTSKFPALVQGMVERNIFFNPTLGYSGHGFEKSSKFREEFDRFSSQFLEGPVGAILPEAIRRLYLNSYTPYAGDHSDMDEAFRKVSLFVKEFADAGGKVIAGTDTLMTQPPGVSLHVEMQMLSEAGLKPMQVLQSVTSWPMEAWGEAKEAGTVEVGKRADLVILNRNPLDDIAATRDIHEVVQAGKVIDREALAHWKDGLPRPTPIQTGPENLLIRIPFIKNIEPDALPVNPKKAGEVTIRGENFNAQCLVLFNDHLVSAKFYDETRLGVLIKSEFLKAPGTYPLVVVRPGSGGAVSNVFYLIVT